MEAQGWHAGDWIKIDLNLWMAPYLQVHVNHRHKKKREQPASPKGWGEWEGKEETRRSRMGRRASPGWPWKAEGLHRRGKKEMRLKEESK